MTELLDVLDAFSTPIKAGWVVWLAWGIGQVFWYRQERQPSYPKRAVPPPSRRASAVRKPASIVHRLVTPEPDVPTTGHVFEASAVAEQFGATARELDSFVADFEMNTRQRRQLPHQTEHSGLGSDAQSSM
jgi:hypothetical protein